MFYHGTNDTIIYDEYDCVVSKEIELVKCVIDGILILNQLHEPKLLRGPYSKCFSTSELFRYEMIVMEEEG